MRSLAGPAASAASVGQAPAVLTEAGAAAGVAQALAQLCRLLASGSSPWHGLPQQHSPHGEQQQQRLPVVQQGSQLLASDAAPGSQQTTTQRSSAWAPLVLAQPRQHPLQAFLIGNTRPQFMRSLGSSSWGCAAAGGGIRQLSSGPTQQDQVPPQSHGAKADAAQAGREQWLQALQKAKPSMVTGQQGGTHTHLQTLEERGVKSSPRRQRSPPRMQQQQQAPSPLAQPRRQGKHAQQQRGRQQAWHEVQGQRELAERLLRDASEGRPVGKDLHRLHPGAVAALACSAQAQGLHLTRPQLFSELATWAEQALGSAGPQLQPWELLQLGSALQLAPSQGLSSLENQHLTAGYASAQDLGHCSLAHAYASAANSLLGDEHAWTQQGSLAGQHVQEGHGGAPLLASLPLPGASAASPGHHGLAGPGQQQQQQQQEQEPVDGGQQQPLSMTTLAARAAATAVRISKAFHHQAVSEGRAPLLDSQLPLQTSSQVWALLRQAGERVSARAAEQKHDGRDMVSGGGPHHGLGLALQDSARLVGALADTHQLHKYHGVAQGFLQEAQAGISFHMAFLQEGAQAKVAVPTRNGIQHEASLRALADVAHALAKLPQPPSPVPRLLQAVGAYASKLLDTMQDQPAVTADNSSSSSATTSSMQALGDASWIPELANGLASAKLQRLKASMDRTTGLAQSLAQHALERQAQLSPRQLAAAAAACSALCGQAGAASGPASQLQALVLQSSSLQQSTGVTIAEQLLGAYAQVGAREGQVVRMGTDALHQQVTARQNQAQDLQSLLSLASHLAALAPPAGPSAQALPQALSAFLCVHLPAAPTSSSSRDRSSKGMGASHSPAAPAAQAQPNLPLMSPRQMLQGLHALAQLGDRAAVQSYVTAAEPHLLQALNARQLKMTDAALAAQALQAAGLHHEARLQAALQSCIARHGLPLGLLASAVGSLAALRSASQAAREAGLGYSPMADDKPMLRLCAALLPEALACLAAEGQAPPKVLSAVLRAGQQGGGGSHVNVGSSGSGGSKAVQALRSQLALQGTDTLVSLFEALSMLHTPAMAARAGHATKRDADFWAKQADAIAGPSPAVPAADGSAPGQGTGLGKRAPPLLGPRQGSAAAPAVANPRQVSSPAPSSSPVPTAAKQAVTSSPPSFQSSPAASSSLAPSSSDGQEGEAAEARLGFRWPDWEMGDPAPPTPLSVSQAASVIWPHGRYRLVDKHGRSRLPASMGELGGRRPDQMHPRTRPMEEGQAVTVLAQACSFLVEELGTELLSRLHSKKGAHRREGHDLFGPGPTDGLILDYGDLSPGQLCRVLGACGYLPSRVARESPLAFTVQQLLHRCTLRLKDAVWLPGRGGEGQGARQLAAQAEQGAGFQAPGTGRGKKQKQVKDAVEQAARQQSMDTALIRSLAGALQGLQRWSDSCWESTARYGAEAKALTSVMQLLLAQPKLEAQALALARGASLLGLPSSFATPQDLHAALKAMPQVSEALPTEQLMAVVRAVARSRVEDKQQYAGGLDLMLSSRLPASSQSAASDVEGTGQEKVGSNSSGCTSVGSRAGSGSSSGSGTGSGNACTAGATTDGSTGWRPMQAWEVLEAHGALQVFGAQATESHLAAAAHAIYPEKRAGGQEEAAGNVGGSAAATSIRQQLERAKQLGDLLPARDLVEWSVHVSHAWKAHCSSPAGKPSAGPVPEQGNTKSSSPVVATEGGATSTNTSSAMTIRVPTASPGLASHVDLRTPASLEHHVSFSNLSLADMLRAMAGLHCAMGWQGDLEHRTSVLRGLAAAATDLGLKQLPPLDEHRLPDLPCLHGVDVPLALQAVIGYATGPAPDQESSHGGSLTAADQLEIWRDLLSTASPALALLARSLATQAHVLPLPELEGAVRSLQVGCPQLLSSSGEGAPRAVPRGKGKSRKPQDWAAHLRMSFSVLQVVHAARIGGRTAQGLQGTAEQQQLLRQLPPHLEEVVLLARAQAAAAAALAPAASSRQGGAPAHPGAGTAFQVQQQGVGQVVQLASALVAGSSGSEPVQLGTAAHRAATYAHLLQALRGTARVGVGEASSSGISGGASGSSGTGGSSAVWGAGRGLHPWMQDVLASRARLLCEQQAVLVEKLGQGLERAKSEALSDPPSDMAEGEARLELGKGQQQEAGPVARLLRAGQPSTGAHIVMLLEALRVAQEGVPKGQASPGVMRLCKAVQRLAAADEQPAATSWAGAQPSYFGPGLSRKVEEVLAGLGATSRA